MGILTEKSFDDCQHIGAAVVNNCDCIVSWNFKHIVNIKTIRGVRSITNLQGYKPIEIWVRQYYWKGMKMEKPVLSPDFTIKDIHKLREYNYEMTKNMTEQERMDYYNIAGHVFQRKIEEARFQEMDI